MTFPLTSPASPQAGGIPQQHPQRRRSVLKIGLLTDTHYADADPRGTRFYRESLGKMQEAAVLLRRDRVDLAIELGDLIDTPLFPSVEAETGFLRAISKEFETIGREQHYVLGNHCVAALTKSAFLSTVGQKRSYYSFDRNGIHLVILDGCFRRDGVAYQAGNFDWSDTDIPREQRDWLEADLKATSNKTLVFVHQRLDLPVRAIFSIRSAPEVRAILEKSGKVLAVFQGHSHGNDYREINGIPYVVLAAMIEGSGKENNGYSSLHVYRDGTLRLKGYRRHAENPMAKQNLLGCRHLDSPPEG